MSNARDIAVTALVHWERDRTFSNIMLDHVLNSHVLSKADSAFATRLVYGTIERLLTLDWLIEKNSSRPLKKLHPTVRAVLRMAVYQLVYMEKIPSSAAVNEAVLQTKRMKQAHASGYVNGVLRAVDREASRLLASLSTDLKSHSLRHSVPLALLQSFKKDYGIDHAVALAAAANEAPPSYIRINTLRITAEAFCKKLQESRIVYEPVEGLPAALRVDDAAALRASDIDEQWYYFQDIASQWACAALDAQPGDRIIDVCAAPGGKSFTTFMHMQGQGSVTACDMYEEKVETLRRRAAQYGVDSFEAICRDASTACPPSWVEGFDRVICDVPCSGFGVIRRRPEIRYKPLEDFEDLAPLQYRILCASAHMVKVGGVLQYSTCTLRSKENEQIVQRFLEEHPPFSARILPTPWLFEAASLPPSHQVTCMPHIHGSDGFFVASFRKEDSL